MESVVNQLGKFLTFKTLLLSTHQSSVTVFSVSIYSRLNFLAHCRHKNKGPYLLSTTVKYAVRPTFSLQFSRRFSLRFKQTIELHPDVNISLYSSVVPLLNNFNIKTQFSPVLYIGILSNHVLHRI